MAVTADKYELPLYIAETIEELSERYGISRSTIATSISREETGRNRGFKFAKVKLTGEE